MPLLRGNLHAHTTFSDGIRSPSALVAEYEARGYDFLAITDHEDWVSSEYWRALRGLAPQLLLFHGVEISYEDFPQHVGRVIGDRETLHVLNPDLASHTFAIPDLGVAVPLKGVPDNAKNQCSAAPCNLSEAHTTVTFSFKTGKPGKYR